MKPITLEIEGFNSFRDRQVIDFKKLTQKGFFGIFGPTGSGKSSILDAITYALYGKIVRDTTGFINLNEEKAVVKYTFEIGKGKDRKIYHIHRVTKKNKEGAYKTTITKLYEMENTIEDLKIICEGKTAVDKKIIEIIGLKDSDFTRAVVLPQGKFSEFLKTSPKERSEMLERLFALQKYGSKLTEKIKKESQRNNIELTRIGGALNSYQGISEKVLEELQVQYNSFKEEEKSIRNKKKNIDEKYEQYKKLWQLQVDLVNKEKEKEEYERNKSLIEEKKIKVERGKSAALVKPFIDSLESTEIKFKKVQDSVINEDKNFIMVKEQLDNLEKQYKEAFTAKEQELPQLNKKEANLVQAIELKDQLKQYEEDIKSLREKYKQLNESKKTIENEIKVEQDKLEHHKSNIKLKEEQINNFFIESEEREKINTGLEVERNLNRVHNELSNAKIDGKQQSCELKADEDKLKNLKKNLEGSLKDIESSGKELEILAEKCPGDNNTVIEKFNNYKEKEKIFEDNKKKEDTKTEKQKQFDEIKVKYESLKEEKQHKECDFKKYLQQLELEKNELNEIEISNLAGIIASKLRDDEPCPVCGNTHKVKLAEIVDKGLIKQKEEKIKQLEDCCKRYEDLCKNLQIKFIQLETNHNNLWKDIDDLTKSLKGINVLEEEKTLKGLVTEYKLLKNNLEKWNIHKEDLNNKIKEEQNKKNQMEIKEAKLVEAIRKSKEIVQKNYKFMEEKKSDYNTLKQQYESLKNELKVENIQQRYKDIVKGDKEKNVLEKQLKDLRNSVDELDVCIKNAWEQVQNKDKEMSIIKESGSQKGKFIENQKNIINTLSEGKEPKEYMEVVKKQISLIINNEKSLKELLQQKVYVKNELEKNIATLNNQKETLSGDLKHYNIKLTETLKENNFISKGEVKDAFIEKVELILFEEEIKKYKEEYYKISNSIEEICGKLNGEKIHEKQWEEIQCSLKDVSNLLDEKIGALAAKENEINKMKKDIEKSKDIIKERDKYEHKKDLLSELEKLFKANKFVEFVAHGQLKYVTAEASKRLSNITRERFELQLLDDGQFYIKDNFSGGLIRSTNSLSGGELFLTSLALALALSSHIQLKGSAPLEFFFLDEGFGTLDDELLDTVMNSLEKLYNEKLSVGIISHVKELRDRVPIKLIVEPSVTGEGTKIKIENS